MLRFAPPSDLEPLCLSLTSALLCRLQLSCTTLVCHCVTVIHGAIHTSVSLTVCRRRWWYVLSVVRNGNRV